MFVLFLSQAIYASEIAPPKLVWSDASPQETEELMEDSVSGQTQFAYRDGCEIGSGFNPGSNSCQKSSAVAMDIGRCPDEFAKDPCILTSTQGKLHDMSRRTTKTSEVQDKMGMEMDIEGTGWGVTASASAMYTSNNLKTSKTVTYWTHFHGDAYQNEIVQRAKLTLKPDAEMWLKNGDVQGFIDQFGSHYISEISYSTSFHAASSFTETSACEGSAYEAALGISYLAFAGGAKVSGSNKECDSETTIESNVEYYGEVVVLDVLGGGADKIMAELDEFKRGLKDNPSAHVVPTKITVRPWLDVDAVRDTIMANTDESEWGEKMALFGDEDPTPNTLEFLTLDWVYTKAVKKTADLYRSYHCDLDAKTAADVKETAKQLFEQMGSRKEKLEKMTKSQMLAVGKQIENGNYDELLGYQAAWHNPVDKLTAICPLNCPNTRDNTPGAVKCKDQLAGPASCVNYLVWKDCDLECGLCACSTASMDGKHPYGSEHCSGRGHCEADCTKLGCTYARCICPEGWDPATKCATKLIPTSAPSPRPPTPRPTTFPTKKNTDASCSANPGCSGLAGDCCPASSGMMLACCYSNAATGPQVLAGTYEVEECSLVEKSCTDIANCAGEVTCTGPTDSTCSHCEPGFSGDACLPNSASATSHHESMGQFGSLLDRLDTYLGSKGFRRQAQENEE